MGYEGHGKHPNLRFEQFTDEEIVAYIAQMPYTCALDLVVPGGLVLDEIAVYFGVTREMIRQIEDTGLRRFGIQAKQQGLDVDVEQLGCVHSRRFIDWSSS